MTGICKACGPVQADLNSQRLNADVKASKFAPSEQLRLNMSIAPAAASHRMGVLGQDLAGFPNGRRLTDDVIDITLQAAEGALLPNPNPALATLGDNVNANDLPVRGPAQRGRREPAVTTTPRGWTVITWPLRRPDGRLRRMIRRLATTTPGLPGVGSR